MTGADRVLHTVRCMGFAELPRIADASGLDPSDVESHLIDLAVDGLVTRRPGAWGLTDAGKAEAAARAGREAAGCRAAIGAAYQRFLVLNPELLDLSSAWLLRRGDDRAPATVVLDRFADLDRRAGDVLADLSAALPRFERYRVRLTAALTRAQAGATEHLTESTDSYHAVWFQLHEDLLVTLGIPR